MQLIDAQTRANNAAAAASIPSTPGADESAGGPPPPPPPGAPPPPPVMHVGERVPLKITKTGQSNQAQAAAQEGNCRTGTPYLMLSAHIEKIPLRLQPTHKQT